MRTRPTFNQILLAVAPRNIQTLEHEAHTASALAVAYPENEAALHAIESDALRQAYRILTETPRTEGNPEVPPPYSRNGADSVFAPLSLMENRGVRQ